MRFEKLNENKIQITLNIQDLIKNNIDTHSFMADPIESQNLFFEILNTAEKEIGFVTKNYNIKIEAFQISGGDFVLTITRSMPQSMSQVNPKKKLCVKRKENSIENKGKNTIYRFNDFDDFCEFSNFLNSSNTNVDNLAKSTCLYEFDKKYYLVFSKLNIDSLDFKKIFCMITEFATYVKNADMFKCKLNENGKLIMKNNAIKTAIEYFS